MKYICDSYTQKENSTGILMNFDRGLLRTSKGESETAWTQRQKKGRKEGGRGERGFREGDSTLPFLSLPLRASTTDLLGKKGELSVTKQRRNAGKRITLFFHYFFFNAFFFPHRFSAEKKSPALMMIGSPFLRFAFESLLSNR